MGQVILFGILALLAVLVMERVPENQTKSANDPFPTASASAAESEKQRQENDASDPNFVEYYKDRRIMREGDKIKVLSRHFPNILEARQEIDRNEV